MSVKKYKGFSIEESKPIDFGRPTWVKYGKEIDIQDYIEAGREDTDIKEVLAKYGCLKPIEKDVEAIYGDFTEYNDLRTSIEKSRKSMEMWDELPVEIKNKFNNDVHEFIDRGAEWAKSEVEKMKKPVAEPAPAVETKGEE